MLPTSQPLVLAGRNTIGSFMNRLTKIVWETVSVHSRSLADNISTGLAIASPENRALQRSDRSHTAALCTDKTALEFDNP